MAHQLWAYCIPVGMPDAGKVVYISVSIGRPRFARHMREGSEPTKRDWFQRVLYAGRKPALRMLGSYEDRADAEIALIAQLAEHRLRGEAAFNFLGKGKGQLLEKVRFKLAQMLPKQSL